MTDPFPADRIWKAGIEQGSLALLRALWREHPQIMRNLGAQRP